MTHPLHASQRFWNDVAESYSKKPIADRVAYERKLDAVRARLGPEHRVLDVGCGTGTLALEVAPRVRQVDAVDLSSAMIEIADHKAREAGIENVNFHHLVVDEHLPFADASFDAVLAFNILHLVDDARATAKKLFELTVPGGHLVSTTPCMAESWIPFGLVLPLMRWVGKAPPVNLMRVDEALSVLRGAGFVDVERQRVSASKTTAFVVARKPHP